MTLDIKEVVPGEYLLNPGLPGPLKGETILLEFNSPTLQSIVSEFAEYHSINITTTKTHQFRSFLVVGLLCKINHRDYDVWKFLSEKKLAWEKLGYKVAYLPPKLRSAAHSGKYDPRERDGLKRTREPPIMYAYMGHNTASARITLSDALVHANLIEPSELYGE
jgi:hypothetical protein